MFSNYILLNNSCIFLGEDAAYKNRSFLLYDGVHYDPLAVTNPQGPAQTIFDASDDVRLTEALALAEDARKVSYKIKKNALKQYSKISNSEPVRKVQFQFSFSLFVLPFTYTTYYTK